MAEAYALVPNATRPELLVPFASPTAARHVTLRRDHLFARARSIASHLRMQFPPLVVFFTREPRHDELLTLRLRSIFDRPDAMLAISWKGRGPDRIPLVHVLTPEGELLGVAKLGWSDPTLKLVANEAAALRRWERRPPRTFTVPALIHESRWEEHGLTVLSPVPMAERVRAARRSTPFEVVHEIAHSGGISLTQLGSTPWWRSLLDRASADPELTVILRWMTDLHGRRLMWHGSSHGDWAADNISAADGRFHVAGWERARDGAPLGLDPISFAVSRRNPRADRLRIRARAAIAEAAPALRRFAIPREDEDLLMACYLAERLVRTREHAAASPPPRHEAALDELRHWVGRA
ncbi:MAG: hypothetical protein ACXVP7_03385 [Actinomycetota bacterium]